MVTDYEGVQCDRYQEALSARLDGEAEPIAPSEVDDHLARGAVCRAWVEDAARGPRLLRTGPALPGLDVTEAVLAAAPGRWRHWWEVLLRVALGMLGTGQLVLGLLQLTAWRPVEPHRHGAAPDGVGLAHLWHESAAWNVAIGAAFLWVATRRSRPAGLVPVLTAFIGLLALLCLLDLLAGQVSITRLASHGLVLVGYLVVLALAHPSLQLSPPGQPGVVPGWQTPSAPPGEYASAQFDQVTPLPSRERPAVRWDQDRPAVRWDRAA